MRSIGGRRGREGSRAQVLVIFVMSALVFVGMCAVVVDVAWYWANSLRVQRAADAAALAGAVLLPANVNNAVGRARAEASKNGYATGGGTVVTPCSDNNLPAGCTGGGGNDRQMNVTVTAPVPTFFMRVFGINSITASRTAKAEYVLPVPMGSPQNYYGVGLFIDAVDTGLKSGTPVSGGQWTNPGSANGSDDNAVALSSTSNGSQQSWQPFGLLTDPNAFPPGAPIDGIEVLVRARYAGSGGPTSGCQIRAQISWNGGIDWSPSSTSSAPTITLTGTEAPYTFGSASDTDDWTGHTWTAADLADNRFRVRLIFNKQSCGNNRRAAVDTLQVRITSTPVPRPVLAPDGTVLAPQNFWGAMQSQGAPNIQGDAFMTKYQDLNPRTNNVIDTAQNPDAFWDPVNYYNYGVQIPPGATGGQIWIFDPGFCEVSTSQGTGESWTVGGSNGNPTAEPVTSYYDVYDTRGTPYDLSDDLAPVASSGTTFRNLDVDDSTLGGSNGSGSCVGLAWHNNWWLLADNLVGGANGTTYRVHTHSNSGDQDDATALNSFAIWATATGGTPRVYGSGAMEAYVRLPGGQASEFYLAQIDAVHAGKTMQIDLWDPGDTGSLSADLTILQPAAGGYVAAPFRYVASRGSTDAGASNCAARYRTTASTAPVRTNTGGTSLFNGCWLRLTIEIDDNYTAPRPSTETAAEGGWWKIRYEMGGSTSSFSTDLTTWKVQIIGNPVHLIVP